MATNLHIDIYFGLMGAGKTFKAGQEMLRQKASGKDVIGLSFAQPIKEIAEDMGFVKVYSSVAQLETNTKYGVSPAKAIQSMISKYKLKILDQEKLDTNINLLTELQQKLKTIIISGKLESEIKDQANLIIRQVMQIIGTEIGRECFATSDTWSEILINKLLKLKKIIPGAYVFIDDLRFQNELNVIVRELRHFGDLHIHQIICPDGIRARRLKVKDLSEVAKHKSETEITDLALISSYLATEHKRVTYSIEHNAAHF